MAGLATRIRDRHRASAARLAVWSATALLVARLDAQTPAADTAPVSLNQPAAALMPGAAGRPAAQPNFPQTKTGTDPAAIEEAGDEDDLDAYHYVSPFSTSDCLTILEEVLAALPQNESEAQKYSTRSLLKGVETTNNYLKQRDELHSTLVGYRWQEVGSMVVNKATYELRRAEWDALTQPQAITALSFEARDGDVMITSLSVFNDANERVANFNFSETSPVILRHSLPRREVFHLWRKTRLARVEITAALAPGRAGVDQGIGRVVIHGGSTNRPEYAKSAIYFLTLTEEDLRSSDPHSGRKDLARAIDELREYKRESRGR